MRTGKEWIDEGHRRQGRWIFAPVADITTPKPGRICYGPRWWQVTDADEVMFFDSYGSPQCNVNKSIVERLASGFNAPPATARFLEAAFLPQRSDV